MLRRIRKQLTCPCCGDVVADAVYRPWPGSLTLTSPVGSELAPLGPDLEFHLARQAVERAQPGADRREAQARIDFITRNARELFYDLRCARGHSTLRTVPQIARALRRSSGPSIPLH